LRGAGPAARTPADARKPPKAPLARTRSGAEANSALCGASALSGRESEATGESSSRRLGSPGRLRTAFAVDAWLSSFALTATWAPIGLRGQQTLPVDVQVGRDPLDTNGGHQAPVRLDPEQLPVSSADDGRAAAGVHHLVTPSALLLVPPPAPPLFGLSGDISPVCPRRSVLVSSYARRDGRPPPASLASSRS
jgi:hypothetical protein